ncbi:hypothetical protein [Corallococcus carmarthensis]|uniref:hypothetical protein n=1 Tax=Corallococcus carmarthensis TaxID=2316728 RepID=UPI00148C8F07|nr:hypothetical protein [Corallococcus carmarthensis]NOK22017.1 hypothetical protein [Corallococcus carmarthensis]
MASKVQSLQTQLSCFQPFEWAPPATVNVGLIASQVTSVVGLSDSIGGVGVKLELVNNQYPTQYVNVVEDRSAAGAGWQTSYIIQDWPGGVGNIVFNQAAGNSTAGQWGYTNLYAFSGSTINALDWNPLVSDHLHEAGTSFSPCYSTGYVFDDGQSNITGALVNTAAGSVVRWTNAYSFRARVNQSWPQWSAEQALYLKKNVASMGDLRIYLRKGSTVHGPIRPVSRFTIPEATCVQNNGSACNTVPYDYAVLVWNILGVDVGIAIPDLSDGVSLNMEETTYCSNANDLTCGNINFHAWKRLPSANILAGSVRTVARDYVIGTLPQLAALGYTIQ